MNLQQLTITEAHNKIKNKEITATELTQSALDEIEKSNPKINSFITVTKDLALNQAKAIDEKIQTGEEVGILAGIPVALKDNILVKDLKCTAGSKILENYTSPYDATVVERLKQAGAIIVGKTNLDEFAMGSSGENSAYGPTKNPLDHTRVPGGSSSGSTAAVAANQCIFALGSDTGGSIREPASFCGVVGLKPTYGRVSRYGLIALASSLDQIGPLTKTVEDARIIFEAIKGKDKFDSTTADDSQAAPTEKADNLRGIKIGIPREYLNEETKGLESEVKDSVSQAIEKLKSLGAEILQINLPHTEYVLPVYYLIMAAEASANLARFDGIKYGLSEGNSLLDVYLKSRDRGLGAEPKRRIMLGAYALSSGYYDAYYLKAKKVQALIKNDFDQAFKSVDALVTPVAPTTAFKLGEKSEDPLTMYLSDIFTLPVNLAGLPAISIPSCPVKEGVLPVGLQIISNQFREDLLFKIAGIYENLKL